MQQTRVSQGLPYYAKFTERFKNVRELAESTEEEVLSMWQGLGYYSRGRNLLHGARYIVEEFQGNMPASYNELIKVKGIGNYTASAIASIAFGERVACVDGNVYRVISRVFGIEEDLAYSAGQKKVQELSQSLIPGDRPGDYNQAVMEFGALQCTPKNPDCESCIFREGCYANLNAAQQRLPFKSWKTQKKERYLNYMMFSHEGEVLMRRRPEGDIWQGLHDFYEFDDWKALGNEEEMMNGLASLNPTGSFMGSRDYRHILSHQEIHARIAHMELESIEELDRISMETGLKKFGIKELPSVAKPVLINKYLNDEIF